MVSFNRVNISGMQYKISEVFNDVTCQTAIRIGDKQIIVNASIQSINQAWYDWQQKGLFIQDAFNFLSSSEREFIMTGTTDDEWKKLFSPKHE